MRGPLTLMAVKDRQDGPVPTCTREGLLQARRVSAREWETRSTQGRVALRPFTSMGERPYTTYVKVV
ncbi:MAG TPA: hypothetical protein VFU68_02760, partial [Terracidiphilus sp.]|nr:hypothetical protein [Terracidiphilus sp.]